MGSAFGAFGWVAAFHFRHTAVVCVVCDGVVELDPLGQRQRLAPRVHLGQFVHQLDQLAPVALVHVVELVFDEPFAHAKVVAFAGGLCRASLLHGPFPANDQGLANRQPVRPRRLGL